MKNVRELSNVMAAGGYLADAVRSIGEVTKFLDVADQADAMLKNWTVAPDIESPLSTGEVTQEWLDRAANQELAVGELRRKQRLLTSLRETAQEQAVDLVEGSADLLLLKFGVDLATLLNEVRSQVGGLKGARTAGEAITNGTTARWTKIQAMAERNNVIRAAQQKVMVNFYPELLANHRSQWSLEAPASDCYMSNLDDIWPGCINSDTAMPDRAGGRTEPWPADEVEQLIWAATSSAQPWIPLPAQLEELNRRRIEEHRLMAAGRGNSVSPTARSW
jgi:hypothetical protein